MFDFKNKLHNHIRSRECQKSKLSSAIKSIATHKSDLTQLSTSKKDATNDMNIAIEKGETNTRPATTFSSAIKSKIINENNTTLLLTHKRLSSEIRTLTTIAFTPSTTSPPTYRAISPPSPIYQATKLYLTIADLYMRYAPLKSINSMHFRPTITRPTMILSIISMQNLYEKFHDKKKRVIPTPNRILNSSTNQNITFDCQKSSFKCSNSIVKASFSTTTKLIAQRLTT